VTHEEKLAKMRAAYLANPEPKRAQNRDWTRRLRLTVGTVTQDPSCRFGDALEYSSDLEMRYG
jgi:hypothetical protein